MDGLKAWRSGGATTQHFQDSGARVISHQDGDIGYFNHLEDVTRKHQIYVTFKQEPISPRLESQQVARATVHCLFFRVCDTQHLSSTVAISFSS